jgi:multiple sugar transport system permease protein
MLKGFFDSLPQELYEAASMNGASEPRMFWTITVPLSMPVLAVIALFAFGTAYGSFLWALTVCQDPRMWTLMVFLQQFQVAATGAPYLVMASLVIAAIPTTVVFLSAQKVLMRGIVVPVEK